MSNIANAIRREFNSADISDNQFMTKAELFVVLNNKVLYSRFPTKTPHKVREQWLRHPCWGVTLEPNGQKQEQPREHRRLYNSLPRGK